MKTKDTRSQIIEVAQDLIQRVGVNAMSYRDISEAIGIRKAGVHYHFQTKDELLSTLLESYSASVLKRLDEIFSTSETPEAKLRLYCALFETTMSNGNQDKICLGGIVGAEIKSLNPDLTQQLNSFYYMNESGITKILIEGQQKGDFNFSGDAHAMACLIFSMLQGGMLLTRVKNDASAQLTMIEQLIGLVRG